MYHVSEQRLSRLQVSARETGEDASQSCLPDVLQTAFNSTASAQESLRVRNPSAQYSALNHFLKHTNKFDLHELCVDRQ